MEDAVMPLAHREVEAKGVVHEPTTVRPLQSVAGTATWYVGRAAVHRPLSAAA
jgi:hypothetical protein